MKTPGNPSGRKKRTKPSHIQASRAPAAGGLQSDGAPGSATLPAAQDQPDADGTVSKQSTIEDITDRKRAEETLRFNESRLEALLRLDEMGEAPLAGITRFAMEEGVRLTQSRMGYLAFMNEDETVLTMHSWSRTAMAQCRITEKPIAYPMETVGLWGEAVRQRKPIVTNDYPAPSPLKKGYPAGHVPVTRHMNVPIFEGGRIVAVAGVGNKREPYDDSDVRQLQLLMDGMWRLIHRKRTAEALRRNEEKFKRLIETNGTGYVILDDQGRVADANLEYVRMTGRQRLEEILGRNVLEWTAPHDHDRNGKAVKECLARGLIRNLEIDYVAPDGRATPIEVNATVLRSAGTVQILTLCRDITERKGAQEALRQSEERLRLAIEAGGLAYWEIDLVTGEVIPSPRLHEMFGLPPIPDPEFREHWRPRFHEDDRQSIREAADKAAQGVPCRIQYRIRTPDGSVRWQQCEAIPVPDAAGKFTRLIGMVSDITDRKQAAEALRKAKDELEQRVAERTAELSRSQARLDTIFRASPAGIFLAELADGGRVLEVNDACPRLLGYTAQEVVGRHSTDLDILVNRDDRKRSVEMLKRDGRVENLELQYRHKSGQIVDVLLNALPVDVDGVPCILGTLLDITQRKRAESSLRRSEEMLNLIFQHSNDGINIVEVDPKTGGHRLVLCNDRYVEMTGYTRQQLFASEDISRFTRADNDAKEIKEYYGKIAQGAPFTGRASWVRPDRKENYFEWTACSTRVDGKILIVGVDRDITERKRAEEQLKEANLGLERSTSRLRALTLELTRVEQQERRRIAELLHDNLQQLLVAAKLNVAALSQDPLDEKQRDSACRAVTALDEAIAQSKSLAVELNPPVLREGGLGNALQWLGRRMRQTHDMAIEVEAKDDRGRIDQDSSVVLFNAVRELLLNVLKHANVKSATVEMSIPRGRKVRIVVADRGSGFAREVTGSANDSENGLGLLAVRERMESLGGAMEIESRPGQGSRITLTAPLRPSAQPAKVSPRSGPSRPPGSEALTNSRAELRPQAAARAKVRAGRTAGPGTVGDAARKRIQVLLVDDHAIVRQGVAQLLSGDPEITVAAEASNGKEAIELTRQLRPDVVVMDVNMPEMSGVEATRTIHARWPEVLIIGLSMYHEPHRAEEMRRAGAVGYVNKSEVTETLLSTIRACCKK
jgi:PAS domain S-box-containing protein